MNVELNRKQAIRLLDRMSQAYEGDSWLDLVEEYYDEFNDVWPSIYELYRALGITEEEYKEIYPSCEGWPEVT